MAIIGNRALIPILDAVDQISAENRRQRELFRLDQKQQERLTRQQKAKSTQNKLSFAKSLLSNPLALDDTKKQASGLITSILSGEETDFSQFQPQFQARQRTSDIEIDTPDIVKEFFPNAPDKAPKSVVQMLLSSATTQRGQNIRSSKGDRQIKVGESSFSAKDMSDRIQKFKDEARRSLRSGFKTESGTLTKGFNRTEVSKFLEKADRLQKAVLSGKLSKEEQKEIDELQPFLVEFDRSERRGKAFKSLEETRKTNQKLLETLRELAD